MAARWLPRAGLLSAAFTTLCCLGISAALSLATAVGATFLTQDATLQPLLVVTLALTVLGSALTFRRHRNPAPLALTIVASVLVYLAVFGPPQSAGAHAGHHDHAQAHQDGHAGTHDTAAAAGGHDAMHDTATSGGHSDAHATTAAGGGSGSALAWLGLAALIAAQLWDAVRVRRCDAVQHRTPKGAL